MTDLNQRFIPEYNPAEWDAAIEDYKKKNRKGNEILHYRFPSGPRWMGPDGREDSTAIEKTLQGEKNVFYLHESWRRWLTVLH